jgi:hypothetical protein
VYKRIVSAVKRVKFRNDRTSYIMLGGRWCHITALKVHAPTKNTKLRGLSPRANYTDRATAVCWRS